MATNKFCEITSEILALSELSKQASYIPPELYSKYDVKRGLRDINGKGVLVGLTEISDVCSTEIINGETVPAEGKLFYAAYQLCKGYYFESSQQGYDEYARKKRPHPIFL